MAIFRIVSSPLDLSKYNVQEIGLAQGLLKLGISVDIYSRFTDIKNEKNSNYDWDKIAKKIFKYYFLGLFSKLIKDDNILPWTLLRIAFLWDKNIRPDI